MPSRVSQDAHRTARWYSRNCFVALSDEIRNNTRPCTSERWAARRKDQSLGTHTSRCRVALSRLQIGFDTSQQEFSIRIFETRNSPRSGVPQGGNSSPRARVHRAAGWSCRGCPWTAGGCSMPCSPPALGGPPCCAPCEKRTGRFQRASVPGKNGAVRSKVILQPTRAPRPPCYAPCEATAGARLVVSGEDCFSSVAPPIAADTSGGQQRGC